MGDKGPVREDHWWERVFNEASSNVNVQKSESGKIKVDLNDKNGVEITNKSFSMKKLKESKGTLQYGSFLKSATLLANVGKEEEINDHIKTSDIEIRPITVLSDEDLFKACNGRTAHKGARHGLNLNGKLQRIAEQERILLEKMKNKQNKHEVFREPYAKRSRPTTALNSSREETTSDDTLPIDPDTDYMLKHTKKRRKKDNYRDKQLAKKINAIGLDESMEEPVEQSVLNNEAEVVQDREGTPIRKKKKKSKELKKFLEDICESEIPPTEEPQRKKKKKKSKRKIDFLAKPIDEEPEPVFNVKRVKLNDSYEASEDEVDIVAKLNAERNEISELATTKKARKALKRKARENEKQVEKVTSSFAESL